MFRILQLVLKRLFDIVVSLIGIILLSPVLLVVAVLVAFKLGTPIFFIQVRPGKDAKPFNMVKFRTMTNERDSNGDLKPNLDRLTSFGKWLRSTSMDELPELYNVLTGSMSLIGPRPLLMEYIDFYNEEEFERHRMRPGITGWAQINGRNSINWEERMRLDIEYVNGWSILFDLKVFSRTFLKVLRREGIQSSEKILMPRFDDYVKKGRKLL